MNIRQEIRKILEVPFRVDYGWPLTNMRRKKQEDKLVKLFKKWKKI